MWAEVCWEALPGAFWAIPVWCTLCLQILSCPPYARQGRARVLPFPQHFHCCIGSWQGHTPKWLICVPIPTPQHPPSFPEHPKCVQPYQGQNGQGACLQPFCVTQAVLLQGVLPLLTSYNRTIKGLPSNRVRSRVSAVAMVAVRMQAWAEAAVFPTRGGNLSWRKATCVLESRWHLVDILLTLESPMPEISHAPGSWCSFTVRFRH